MNKTAFFTALPELLKVRITIVVSLTTIAGYVLANRGFSVGLILPVLGLFLIACASAAINQYQERKTDAGMLRTSLRPIPSGKISEKQAVFVILVLIISGSLIIYFSSNIISLLLAWLAIVWYNLIYTPLKKITAFAVVPGSVIGAIPPAVGWTAAGGDISDPRILILAFFFFIWQIPHFWLLLMKYGKEYEIAGFPSLTAIYSEQQLRNITFMWTFATAISCLFIPYFGITSTVFAKLAILLISLSLIITFIPLLVRKNHVFRIFRYFMLINVFLLLVVITLAIDAISH